MKLRNNFRFSEAKPVFQKQKVAYSRMENHGACSISINTDYLSPLFFNKTAMEMIELFDGNHSIKQIYTCFCEKYDHIDESVLSKDLYDTIMKLWKLGLVLWKGGENPYMEDYKYEITEKVTMELAFDNKLAEIMKFIKNQQDYPVYVNPLSEQKWDESYVLRAALFSMSAIILMIYESGKLSGLLILVPASSKRTSCIVEYICIINLDLLQAIIKKLNIVLKDGILDQVTKLSMYTKVENENDMSFIRAMIPPFKRVCLLKKEIDELDIALYEHIIKK